MRLTAIDSQGTSFGESSFTGYDKPTPGQLDAVPATVEALSDVTMTGTSLASVSLALWLAP